MAEISYNVVFRGEIASRQSLEDVKKKFAALYKVDVAKIERKFFTRKLVIVKTKLDHQTARKYQSILMTRTGAIFEIEAVKPAAPQQAAKKFEGKSVQTPPPSEPLYNLVFYREIAKGHDTQIVKNKLAGFFNVPATMVESMFAGNHMVLKENVDYQTAESFRKAFENTGAMCRIEVAEQKSKSIETQKIQPSASVKKQIPPKKIVEKPPKQSPPLQHHKKRMTKKLFFTLFILILMTFGSFKLYNFIRLPALITIANLHRVKEVGEIDGFGILNDVAFSPDGKMLAVTDDQGPWIY